MFFSVVLRVGSAGKCLPALQWRSKPQLLFPGAEVPEARLGALVTCWSQDKTSIYVEGRVLRTRWFMSEPEWSLVCTFSSHRIFGIA